VGRHGHVTSFEPHPTNVDILDHHTQHYDNVIVNQCGLGQSSTTKTMPSIQPGNGGVSFDDPGTVNVPVFCGDKFAYSYDSVTPDMIKIDVQGHGLNVLRGMKQLLDLDGPDIVIEPHGNSEKINERLGYYGYEIESQYDNGHEIRMIHYSKQ